MSAGRSRRLGVPGLLALLPLVAYAPAWWTGRLLAPGDGVGLHLPLRLAVWEAWRAGELPSWNPEVFGGAPLLAAYRPGALYPPMVALSWLEPLLAFQTLVLGSLCLAALLTFLYARRLGANRLGAWVAGLGFSLGPYLVGHLGDTATVVAAPLLPLVLLAAEAHMRREGVGRAAGLAAALALLWLAGSPVAARAGAALLLGRLVIGHALAPARHGPGARLSLVAVASGTLLAAPQLLPSLLALPDAGRQVAGFATEGEPLPGVTGLILRYVSHTPAPALALAALPLALTQLPVRVFGMALALCLALQWGRGPLAAPGALSLVFDLMLAILAGLSLSEQWRRRRTAEGRRLRAYFLVASLASAAALSVAAAALGPLSNDLAGAVGVLALALILYLTLAEHADPFVAGVFLLPLSVSFLLQPQGRGAWADAPMRVDLEEGPPTRRAVDRAIEVRRGEPLLSLVRGWPHAAVADLAFAGWGARSGRVQVTGYDPMAPLRTRQALGGVGAAGAFPGGFFRTDPRRLEMLGVRWVQAPDAALQAPPGEAGLGERLDLTLEPDRPRFFPIPIAPATEIRIGSWMSDAVALADGTPIAHITVRLASGRTLEPLTLRVGRDTGEWAWERPDVRGRIRHALPPILESWREGRFVAHRYLATLRLPGRYLVDGVRLERLPGGGILTLAGIAVYDAVAERPRPVSHVAAYLSDADVLREVAAPPGVRLFEVHRTLSPARVVAEIRLRRDDDDVLAALAAPAREGIDPRRTALAVQGEAGALPPESRSGPANLARASRGSLEVRATGPGLLVLPTSWDPGWEATLDDGAAPVWRVQHSRVGVPLAEGPQRVLLRHRPRGFVAGLLLASLPALSGSVWLLRRGRGRRARVGATSASDSI